MRENVALQTSKSEEEVHEEPKCNPFGTRYLTDETRVWEHNAWDNVDWSEEMEQHARQVVETQKTQAVEDAKAKQLLDEPAKQWDAFYSQHNNNFFKDRNWLLKEFPELDMNNHPEGSTVRVLEVGCGVGNTSLPLVQWDEHRRMYLYCCDYSDVAVQVLKQNDKYDTSRMHGFVWDITQDPPEDAPAKESLDYVVCIYVLSAIHPSKARQAVHNLEISVGGSIVSSMSLQASPRLRGVIYRHTKAIHDREKALAADGRGVAAIKEAGENTETTVVIPRYARINTLKWTAEEAIETLTSEDWKVVEVSPEDDFAKCVGNMAEDEVLIDPHVENLLIFPHSNDFHRYWLVEQRYLILQDKASCLPAFLLAPSPGSHVFDTCAAPGMKTSHVASIVGETGKVWAMDRSEERVTVMNQILEECGVQNASVFHGDFLKTDVTDKKFLKVKYAIVDPPCSGSGMVKRMDELTGGNADKGRLEKLKNLQAMILKHALKFPNLQRAVYSTCSIHEEENEQVVDEVLLDTYVRQHFRLASPILPAWNCRGLDSYEFGSDCLRADPAKTLTNGFFVAMFERISEDCGQQDNKNRKKKKHKERDESMDIEEMLGAILRVKAYLDVDSDNLAAAYIQHTSSAIISD
ncbi:methyltransferase domain protein [Ancylostoma caninum]|uniref:Methyltransferase domain protein n=1 Tax=Ancylostoma caninum TaxID=29170 RepID=A0A368GNZ3_ANCCA|nr:methyltransferase domain protein [Ancylostoma caninum]